MTTDDSSGDSPSSGDGGDANPSSSLGAEAGTPDSDSSASDASASGAADGAAPESVPPASGTPDSAPPDSTTPDSAPPDSADPASGATDSAPPDSAAPTSAAPDSSGCAEIPAYPHAVLTAAVKLEVQIPYSTDQASQLPHKFTLTNDDSSYSKTLALESDCQAGESDGTALLTFEDLVEGHTYTLQCDNGTATFALFSAVPYDQLVQQLAAQGDGQPADSAPASDSSGSGDSSDGANDSTGTS